jgi:hypothetical protein
MNRHILTTHPQTKLLTRLREQFPFLPAPPKIPKLEQRSIDFPSLLCYNKIRKAVAAYEIQRYNVQIEQKREAPRCLGGADKFNVPILCAV